MNTIDVTLLSKSGHKAVGASEVLTVLPQLFFSDCLSLSGLCRLLLMLLLMSPSKW